MQEAVLPILLLVICLVGLVAFLLLVGNLFNPGRSSPVKRMPYESGMDPIHDTRRRFGVRFYLVAIAFLVFDVELLFLYPWAVAFPRAIEQEHAERTETQAEAEYDDEAALRQAAEQLMTAEDDDATQEPEKERSGQGLFIGGMVFIVLLTLGLIYDWRKGIFRWR